MTKNSGLVTDASKRLIYLEGYWPQEDEEDNTNDDGATAVHLEVGEETPEISLHAIYGAHVPQKMHVRGNMGKQGITVLVYSGSTHNFLSDNIGKKIGVVPSSEGHLEVAVANGNKLASPGWCKGVKICPYKEHTLS